MKTTEELRELLREAGCVPSVMEDSNLEWWRNKECQVKPFPQMVFAVLERCTCCGELDKGPSAACNARHENKDCNCFAKDVA